MKKSEVSDSVAEHANFHEASDKASTQHACAKIFSRALLLALTELVLIGGTRRLVLPVQPPLHALPFISALLAFTGLVIGVEAHPPPCPPCSPTSALPFFHRMCNCSTVVISADL